MQSVVIKLTPEQIEKLEPFRDALQDTLKETGYYGMVIGQPEIKMHGVTGRVAFGLLKSKVAAQVLKAVNPEIYQQKLREGEVPAGLPGYFWRILQALGG